jgi:hypothetical protein
MKDHVRLLRRVLGEPLVHAGLLERGWNARCVGG